DLAEHLFARQLLLLRQSGDTTILPPALIELGDLARLRGDFQRAGMYYREALLVRDSQGMADSSPQLYQNLGHVALHQDQLVEAADHYSRALEQYQRDWDDDAGAAECVVGLACVAGQRQPERAARLYGAALALLDRRGLRLWPGNQATHEVHLGAARTRLGEEVFAARLEAGRELPFSAAIAEALQLHARVTDWPAAPQRTRSETRTTQG